MLGAALTILVAVLHFYFLVLEMFLWTTPRGLKTFGQTLEKARETAALAANQGLYNGFFAAGLVWGFFAKPEVAFETRIFFLVCVVVAGVYGGLAGNRHILFVQAIPAALALALTLLAR